jgi:hypothetical protein
MDTLMTMEEIEARFDGEWVLIEDPVWNELDEVAAGRVRLHGRDHEAPYREAMELGPARAAVSFIGQPPEDIAYIL